MGWLKLATAAISLGGLLSKTTVDAAITGNILWDPTFKTCDNVGAGLANLGATTNQQVYDKLFSDMEQLGSFTADSMGKVDSLMASTNEDDRWEAYRIASLFDYFFNIQDSGGSTRFNNIKGVFTAMSTVGTTNNLYIMCDDAPMWTPIPGGQQMSVPHSTTGQKVDMPGQVTCASAQASGKTLIAYRLGRGTTTADNPMYVIICSKQGSGDIFLDQVANSPKSGDILDKFRPLSGALFHEMLHVLYPAMRGDMSGGTDPNGERYGVVGASEVRATYSDANPDSYAMFALALALDLWFWHTGTAQTKLEVWQQAVSTPAGKQMLQNFKIDVNNPPK